MAIPNTSVYRGSSATLTLASITTGRAGQMATNIFNTEYQGKVTVGRLTGVEVRVTTDLEAFHEIGTRRTTTVSPGNINVFGRIERAYINGALLRLLLGKLAGAGQNEDALPDELQPNFIIVLNFVDPRADTNTEGTRLTIDAVRFDDWVLTVPQGDFIMENMTFKAISVTREEVA
jgi:hypothetical protein